MKRVLLPLLTLGLCLAVLSAIRAGGVVVASGSRTGEVTALAGGAIFSGNGNDERTRAVVRQRLRRSSPGTYIAEILQERDSSLARWPDRRNDPLTVWIQPTANIADFTTVYVEQVRNAFNEWNKLSLPVGFRFVPDSAEADVHVTWVDHFDEPISGRTKWARDDDWWITDADIILAVHHHQGETLDPDAMRAMALHEIGHLLGLDHTTDPTSIMAPKVRVRDLSNADRATVRLLYTLPPGAVHG